MRAPRGVLAAALLLPATLACAAPAPDPLRSTQWPAMQHALLHDEPVVFDARVEVLLPPGAEDSLQVPVAARWPALADVRRVLAFVDFNPIPRVLEYRPHRAGPFLGFRVRVQQATPIRVAVQTGDGVWHVGGAWVDAAGGGCTLPPAHRATLADADLGRVEARRWPLHDGGQRLKLRIEHPNDTGLVAGIPAFFVERLSVYDEAGAELAVLDTFEPLAENPVLTLEPAAAGPLVVRGRDNAGNAIAARVD
ncbi:sulfur-oxidizing protein SoxY [Plasticicumulans lactativorans]|uniref:Sulfur-oxidizing protein SoxY n=1 Tax=Plasticicumulans lactativorans TaxID=1133106 RepID=A0A4R2LU45_9GAMM|nr:quinoprotein dehydrogenase-associated SoxYZ-like carrier [Plasticicumulans lactativorans]TCO83393.1 sulfur-oxidizing protein SoxY [Plasticicumulans lactativorans]